MNLNQNKTRLARSSVGLCWGRSVAAVQFGMKLRRDSACSDHMLSQMVPPMVQVSLNSLPIQEIMICEWLECFFFFFFFHSVWGWHAVKKNVCDCLNAAALIDKLQETVCNDWNTSYYKLLFGTTFWKVLGLGFIHFCLVNLLQSQVHTSQVTCQTIVWLIRDNYFDLLQNYCGTTKPAAISLLY